MSIKAIIFDFFGVISSEVSPFWFAERFSKEEALILKNKYMTPADKGEVTEEELYDILSKLSGDTPEEIERDFEKKTVINDELVAYIEELRKSYKVILLSNALGSWLRKIFARHNLERLFDEIIISSEVDMIKPNAEIFKLALEKLNVNAKEAVFIDDNISNVIGAKNVEMHALQYKNVQELKKELNSLFFE